MENPSAASFCVGFRRVGEIEVVFLQPALIFGRVGVYTHDNGRRISLTASDTSPSRLWGSQP